MTDLVNHFLIAMPALQDPNFTKSVLYVVEQNEDGTVAIIINHPLGINMEDALAQMKIRIQDKELRQEPIFFGGPVQQERGFVLHRPHGQWRSSLKASDEITVTTSQDILEAMAEGKGPTDAIVALGYAGWENEQLHEEITHNIWLSVPASPKILFETPPHERWHKAGELLGVDMNQLSTDFGHA